MTGGSRRRQDRTASMFKTQTLESIKRIFPRIHHALPLSQRESQQLLNVLISSFRKHLDKEHGFSSKDELRAVPQPPLTYLSILKSGSVPDEPSQDAVHRPYERPTDRHLSDILENPLFARGTNEATDLAARDPRDVFKMAVWKGMMTIKRAHGFLETVQKIVRSSSSATLMEGMKAWGAGLLVCQWLRTSGEEKNLSFVRHSAFACTLLRFMVAESLDELAMRWLDRLLREEQHTDDVTVEGFPAWASILDAYVSAKALSISLENAFSSMVEGTDMVMKSDVKPRFLIAPWRRLAWAATVESLAHSSPTSKLYDRFTNIPASINCNPQADLANLHLHHPTRPDHELALEYLSRRTRWSRLETAMQAWAGHREGGVFPRQVTKTMSMGIDTIHRLMQLGEQQDAQRIFEVLVGSLGSVLDFGLSPKLKGQEPGLA